VTAADGATQQSVGPEPWESDFRIINGPAQLPGNAVARSTQALYVFTSGLLPLDGNVAGHKLKIAKPYKSQLSLKLVPAAPKQKGVTADEKNKAN